MSPLMKRLFLGFMPRILMMRRTKYTLPEYDDSIHTNEIDIRDHYREMNVEYSNEYKDNNGHQDYENLPPVHHQGNIYGQCVVMNLLIILFMYQSLNKSSFHEH